MDNDRKSAKLLQEALRQKCAFLEPDPYLAQRVLRLASEKKAGGPRRISRGLAFTLALVLMTATAVGVSLVHRIKVERALVAAPVEEGTGDQKGMNLPFSGVAVDTGKATATSVLSACGHADTLIDWVRRYTPIGTEEHKLVDTYYAMCRNCGEVFWVQDATLLRESHDETMAAYTLGTAADEREPYTCKYCHIQWYGEEP